MDALLVDLYELTMSESYVAQGIDELPATFQLFCRSLPPKDSGTWSRPGSTTRSRT